MIRVADYIASFLAERGVRQLFLVTGGGAMHLNDAFGREARIRTICCHHEQACAMAAESYARLSGQVAAVNVTTGPGGINTFNGVYGAWTDSIPMIVVSGQVKRETCAAFYDLPDLRQLGDQEGDVVSMVRPVTKYAEIVREPRDIRQHLEKAWHLATTGRPGPVWIDVPTDVAGTLIDPETLAAFTPPAPAWQTGAALQPLLEQIREKIGQAHRPVVLVGAGIRLGGARAELLDLLAQWEIPVATAWNAHDLIWDEHPLYAGRPGTVGDRPGNFAVQNSDVLLILGSRLNIRQVGYSWSSFARAAYKIWVDIDAAELNKPTVRPDLAVQADVREVLTALAAGPALPPSTARAQWVEQCRDWRRRYSTVLPSYREKPSPVNPYLFVDELYAQLAPDEIVVCADGTACVATFQAARIQRDQRLYTNSGSASMGYDLPAAIGAAAASGKRVVCLAGDGSIQMNLQELQTIQTHRLPVKIFLLNNNGYHSIRQTQQGFFGLLHGCDPSSGVEFPKMERIAAAYGYPYTRADDLASLPAAIAATLAEPGPAICEVAIDPAQPFAPKQSSRRLPDGKMVSAPLEDLAPFLDREELARNLFIPPLT